MGQSNLINPRYKAYLKTTSKPTNWEYMAFISKMKKLYLIENNIECDTIKDHDKFTQFIKERVFNNG